jgi:hypothetical protein
MIMSGTNGSVMSYTQEVGFDLGSGSTGERSTAMGLLQATNVFKLKSTLD